MADHYTDFKEIKAVADVFEKNPFYLFFGRSFTPLLELENETKPYPAFIQVFFKGLQFAGSIFSAHDYFKDIKKKILKTKYITPFETKELKDALKLFFSQLLKISKKVQEKEYSQEKGIKLAKGLVLNVAVAFKSLK